MILNKKRVEFTDIDLNLINIGEHQEISNENFGVKAASLNNSKSLLTWVPKGFALSKEFVRKIALSNADSEELEKLKFFFNLLSNNGNKNLIVRSSSTLEWLDGNSFAGLFTSIRNIENFENLLSGITLSYKSSHHLSLQNYAKLKSAVLPEEHLGILVQIEVEVKYSALVIIDEHIDLIEFYDNDIINSVQGNKNPLFVIERFDSIINKKGVNSSDTIPKKVQKGVISIVDSVRKELKLNQTVHLEIGSDGVNQFLFQINQLVDQDISRYLPNAFNDQGYNFEIKRYPLKAEAINTFKEIGLFSSELKIYKGLNVLALYEAIKRDFSVENGITIRYSYGDDISLPRGFFKSLESANAWLEKTYKHVDWFVIVHPYIEVRRSFELLLDKKECLLEHIPGMWESDNSFNPDVLYFNNEFSKAWIWKNKRSPLKGIFSANMKDFEAPISPENIIKWQEKLNSVIKKLRTQYFDLLPLNFHFVEDDHGKWNFLNLRRGFNLSVPEMIQKKTFVIRNKYDAINWDGNSPLEMQLKSERGEEKEIIDIIKSLPKIKDQIIIVDFGLLSHPAIILREFGYRLIPNYLYNSERKFSPDYLPIEFDINSDPINRIMKEKPIFEDEEIKVVVDKNEIVSGHFLLVSKKPFTSLVEMDGLQKKLKHVLNNLTESGLINEVIIVERGRARFCTSGFTDSHAHAHILPKVLFKENSKELLIERAKAKKMNSLKDAIKMAKQSDNEYLMIMDNTDNVYLRIMPDNVSLEKQLIRNFFKGQIIG